MKKKLFVVVILLISIFAVSCDSEIESLYKNIINQQNSSITNTSSNTNKSSLKDKSSYKVENIEDFQNLIIETRDYVRNGNILIEVEYFRRIGPFIENKGSSTGSGVIYKGDGNNYYALSNYHVFSNSSIYQFKITILTMDGNTSTGTLLYYDKDKDLAVVSFSLTSSFDVTIVDIDERLDNPLAKDEFLMAIGNPSGVAGNVTFGQFKGMARIANVDYEVIKHSALIYSGNSGGALVDIYGNLVGINTWGSEDSPDESFAIPLDVINEFLDESGLK